MRDVTQPDDAPWTDKYTGVIDFLGIVDWMMEQTWGACMLVLRNSHEQATRPTTSWR